MNLLAFEASTRRLSVALWSDGDLLEKHADVPNGGSEHLLPWAHALLAETGLGFGQLDGVAFGAGPGGFTGLRLACGIAQGLAYGIDRPVVPVGSLAALAWASGRGRVLACLDARMNELYLGGYLVSAENAEEIIAPVVGAAMVLPCPAEGGWRGVGDGFRAAGAVLRERMKDVLDDVDAEAFPSASSVAQLAVPILRRGDGIPAVRAGPIYVRDKVALTTAERLPRGGTK